MQQDKMVRRSLTPILFASYALACLALGYVVGKDLALSGAPAAQRAPHR